MITIKRLIKLAARILIITALLAPMQVNAQFREVPTDADSYLYPDMLLLMLLPQIQEAVNAYYEKLLTTNPVVYPYEINIVEAKRADENPQNRGFHFYLTIEVTPVVGPHITVGRDRISFELSPLFPNNAKITSYQHLTTDELPPNWKHILR